MNIDELSREHQHFAIAEYRRTGVAVPADQIAERYAAWLATRPPRVTAEERDRALGRIKAARSLWPGCELRLVDNTREQLPDGVRWRGEITIPASATLTDLSTFEHTTLALQTHSMITAVEDLSADEAKAPVLQVRLTLCWAD